MCGSPSYGGLSFFIHQTLFPANYTFWPEPFFEPVIFSNVLITNTNVVSSQQFAPEPENQQSSEDDFLVAREKVKDIKSWLEGGI